MGSIYKVIVSYVSIKHHGIVVKKLHNAGQRPWRKRLNALCLYFLYSSHQFYIFFYLHVISSSHFLQRWAVICFPSNFSHFIASFYYKNSLPVRTPLVLLIQAQAFQITCTAFKISLENYYLYNPWSLEMATYTKQEMRNSLSAWCTDFPLHYTCDVHSPGCVSCAINNIISMNQGLWLKFQKI